MDGNECFGEQDFLWMRTFAPRRIVAMNITQLHVEVARQRAAARGVADRVEFQLGSATDLTRALAHAAACHFKQTVTGPTLATSRRRTSLSFATPVRYDGNTVGFH